MAATQNEIKSKKKIMLVIMARASLVDVNILPDREPLV